MAASTSSRRTDQLLVQLGTFNVNLQGKLGIPDDLSAWLSHTTSLDATETPDIVAIGFQELLPFHFGLAGYTDDVVDAWDKAITTHLEKHAPNKERFGLAAKIVNCGVALLVYARDDTIGKRVCDVQTQWTGCGPMWMANKGAVGVRFRVAGQGSDETGEIFTFVNAHLAAHAEYLSQRKDDFKHIVNTLLFPSLPESTSQEPSTIYSTSHLFFFGDLNFRVVLPATHELYGKANFTTLTGRIKDEDVRKDLKEYDQLLRVRREGRLFFGLREGEFWKFKNTYKFKLNTLDEYSKRRTPSWTDRIMYTTFSDSPEEPEKSQVEVSVYTAAHSYALSDHKPVVALLLVPSAILTAKAANGAAEPTPSLKLPPTFVAQPDRWYNWKRAVGNICDRTVGYGWTLLWLLGLGNAAVGIGTLVLGIAAWAWTRWRPPTDF